MIDVHCKGCGKILLKAELFIGAIKCPRSSTCGKIFEYKVVNNTYFTNEVDPAETKSSLQAITERDIISKEPTEAKPDKRVTV